MRDDAAESHSLLNRVIVLLAMSLPLEDVLCWLVVVTIKFPVRIWANRQIKDYGGWESVHRKVI